MKTPKWCDDGGMCVILTGDICCIICDDHTMGSVYCVYCVYSVITHRDHRYQLHIVRTNKLEPGEVNRNLLLLPLHHVVLVHHQDY